MGKCDFEVVLLFSLFVLQASKIDKRAAQVAQDEVSVWTTETENVCIVVIISSLFVCGRPVKNL